MSKINVLKKDATFKVEIRSGMIASLQTVLLNLTKNRSPEELEKLRKAINNPEEELEDWIENIVIIYQFLNILSDEAVKAGVTYEKDVSDFNQDED